MSPSFICDSICDTGWKKLEFCMDTCRNLIAKASGYEHLR